MKKTILIIIGVIIVLSALFYLNNYSLKEKRLEVFPIDEINYEDSNLEESENIKEEEKEKPENLKGGEVKTEIKVDEKKISCEKDGGVWFDYNSSCEINSLSKSACIEKGGEYNECNSACRHEKEATICTMQCVMTCTFKLVIFCRITLKFK